MASAKLVVAPRQISTDTRSMPPFHCNVAELTDAEARTLGSVGRWLPGDDERFVRRHGRNTRGNSGGRNCVLDLRARGGCPKDKQGSDHARTEEAMRPPAIRSGPR